jgi:hypothetical protein
MLKFANSKWNNNKVFLLTIRATQTDENSNYKRDNDNENPKRNDRSNNSDDNSSSDDPISYTGLEKMI